ncbi:hypothetical protein [Methylophilus sp. QUAN]|uniref:hypothetical protein n=1 Tax=Methylophilus sp. QUAN TaxID=2781020 RepID=UPI0018909D35|nr:hypothetical protein [Methylophilus sp. QUAN]MBF4991113.1 hypothetical protein [Methylophilus sp. QUAN]
MSESSIFPQYIELGLPQEFLDMCKEINTTPVEVLHGFIADLCYLQNTVADPRPDNLSRHGSDESRLANDYFDRVGYDFLNQTE